MPRSSTLETSPSVAPVAGATDVVEATTAEAAIEAVRDRLGPDARIVDARRVLRGGIGGFFAKEIVQLHAAAGALVPDAGVEPVAPASSAPGPVSSAPGPWDEVLRSPAGRLAGSEVTPSGTSPVDRLLDAADDPPASMDFATFLRQHLGDGEVVDLGQDGDAGGLVEPDAPSRSAVGADPAPRAGSSAAAGRVPAAAAGSAAANPTPTAAAEAAEAAAAAEAVTFERRPAVDPQPVAWPVMVPAGDTLERSGGHAAGDGAAAAAGDGAEDAAGPARDSASAPTPAAALDDGSDPAGSLVPHVCEPAPATDGGPGWSTAALVQLGLPVELVRSLEVTGPADDLAWTMALAVALRPSCRPLPAGPAVMLGPHAHLIGEVDGAPAARSETWLKALRGGRWLHLVVGGEGWRAPLADAPLAASWARPEDLPDALRCAVELGLVLGYGPLGGRIRRARPLDVALAVRDLVDGR